MYLDAKHVIYVHERIITNLSMTQFRLDVIHNVNKAFLENKIKQEWSIGNPGTSQRSNCATTPPLRPLESVCFMYVMAQSTLFRYRLN